MVPLCRQLMALPFIPVADVNQACTFMEEVAVYNIGDNLHKLLFVYYRDRGIEHDAIHQEAWNCHGKDTSTNNSVEIFQSRFNRLVGRNDPNVWMLTSMMQNEQRRTSHGMS